MKHGKRLIDADELQKKICEKAKTISAKDYWNWSFLTDIEALLDEQPTVDAEPVKHGYWIETIEGTFCSNCNRNPIVMGEFQIANYSTNYCPHCGAKMGEVSE